MTKDISELLPFYLNGTLGDAEKAAVERALAADAGLRTELSALRALQSAVRSQDPGRGPGELGLARLKREIGPAARPVWMTRGGALAAAFALGAILSAAGMSLLTEEVGGTFRQAGGPVAGPQLVVGFRPEATVAEMSDLLLSQDATIEDGPSALGLYRVTVPEGSDPAQVAGALVAADKIVESAERAE